MGFFGVRVSDEGGEAGDGNGGTVDAGHEEAAEDDFVKGRIGTPYRNNIWISGAFLTMGEIL